MFTITWLPSLYQLITMPMNNVPTNEKEYTCVLCSKLAHLYWSMEEQDYIVLSMRDSVRLRKLEYDLRELDWFHTSRVTEFDDRYRLHIYSDLGHLKSKRISRYVILFKSKNRGLLDLLKIGIEKGKYFTLEIIE